MSDLTCPICDSKLIDKFIGQYPMVVMDGNSLYCCTGPVKHEFWVGARCTKVYHFSAVGVSQTQFGFDRRWELTQSIGSHVWKELPREDPEPAFVPKIEPQPKIEVPPKISFTIGSAGFDTNKFRELIYKAEDRAKATGVSVAHVVAEALESLFDTNEER